MNRPGHGQPPRQPPPTDRPTSGKCSTGGSDHFIQRKCTWRRRGVAADLGSAIFSSCAVHILFLRGGWRAFVSAVGSIIADGVG